MPPARSQGARPWAVQIQGPLAGMLCPNPEKAFAGCHRREGPPGGMIRDFIPLIGFHLGIRSGGPDGSDNDCDDDAGELAEAQQCRQATQGGIENIHNKLNVRYFTASSADTINS